MPDENKPKMLDEKLLKELEEMPYEDPLLTEYGVRGEGNEDKTRFAEKWFPGENEWKGKTIITPQQAHAMAVSRHLGKIFPEIGKDMNEFINNALDDYEMYLTSIEGIGREQQAGILRSMFGGPTEADETARTAFLSMIAGKGDDNDD